MYRRNSDESLRKLERESHEDPVKWMRWYYELVRTGRQQEYLDQFNLRLADDLVTLTQPLEDANYQIPSDGVSQLPGSPMMCPEPPPSPQFLRQMEDPDTYYVSEVGDFGKVEASGLAMHEGIVGAEIDRFILTSYKPPRVTEASVEYYLSTRNRNSISRGGPSEILSYPIRRKIGFNDPQIPQLSELHQPMITYNVTIVGSGDGIYRAGLEVFYFLRSNSVYWRVTTDDWDYRIMSHIIETAWPNYSEAIN